MSNDEKDDDQELELRPPRKRLKASSPGMPRPVPATLPAVLAELREPQEGGGVFSTPRDFFKITESPTAALILGQALYWASESGMDRMFRSNQRLYFDPNSFYQLRKYRSRAKRFLGEGKTPTWAVTYDELAREFGVSVSTAKRIIKKLCKDGLIDKELACSRNRAMTHISLNWYDVWHRCWTKRYQPRRRVPNAPRKYEFIKWLTEFDQGGGSIVTFRIFLWFDTLSTPVQAIVLSRICYWLDLSTKSGQNKGAVRAQAKWDDNERCLATTADELGRQLDLPAATVRRVLAHLKKKKLIQTKVKKFRGYPKTFIRINKDELWRQAQKALGLSERVIRLWQLPPRPTKK